MRVSAEERVWACGHQGAVEVLGGLVSKQMGLGSPTRLAGQGQQCIGLLLLADHPAAAAAAALAQ